MNATKIAIVLFMILLQSAPSICAGQEYYQSGGYRLIRSDPNVPLVSKLDAQELFKKYMGDFQVTLGYSQEDAVVVYFLSKKDGDNYYQIMFMVGLHPSVREAEEAMLNALNHQDNVQMNEWPVNEVKIGESSWYHPNPRSGNRLGVAFIRSNAVFWIYYSGDSDSVESEYTGIETLAREIDHDLINGASYLTIPEKVNPPFVESVDLSQTVFKEGERGTLTIHAVDPEGRRILFYGNSINGLGGASNKSLIIADPRVWAEPFAGQHTIKCWVVNEDNFFSTSDKEVKITF